MEQRILCIPRDYDRKVWIYDLLLFRLISILLCISLYIYSQRLAYSMETADSREVHKNFNIFILSECFTVDGIDM